MGRLTRGAWLSLILIVGLWIFLAAGDLFFPQLFGTFTVRLAWSQPYSRLRRIRKLVRAVVKTCHRAEAQCWLDSGTLLGQYRHQRVLPHDKDADFGMLHPDFARLLQFWKSKKNRQTFLQEFPGIELRIVRPTDDLKKLQPRDVVARMMEVETGVYADMFLFLEGGENCGFTKTATRPSKNNFPEWPSDLSSAQLNQYHGFNANTGCNLIHGVFATGWNDCVSCEARIPVDGRKRPEFKSNWIFPLKNCTMEGLEYALCPRDTTAYLTYLLGKDLTVPILQKPLHVVDKFLSNLNF